MRSKSTWMIFNAVVLFLLAMGIGIFLKVARGMSAATASVYAAFLAVIFLAPVIPQLVRSLKAESEPRSATQGFQEIASQLTRPKRLVAFLALFVSIPVLAGISALVVPRYIGFFPSWIPLMWLTVFIVGTVGIFWPRK